MPRSQPPVEKRLLLLTQTGPVCRRAVVKGSEKSAWGFVFLPKRCGELDENGSRRRWTCGGHFRRRGVPRRGQASRKAILSGPSPVTTTRGEFRAPRACFARVFAVR